MFDSTPVQPLLFYGLLWHAHYRGCVRTTDKRWSPTANGKQKYTVGALTYTLATFSRPPYPSFPCAG